MPRWQTQQPQTHLPAARLRIRRRDLPPTHPHIDLRFPSHFSNGADVHDWHATGDPRYELSFQLENLFSVYAQGKNICASISLSEAVLSIERILDPENPRKSPLFFAVSVLPHDAGR